MNTGSASAKKTARSECMRLIGAPNEYIGISRRHSHSCKERSVDKGISGIPSPFILPRMRMSLATLFDAVSHACSAQHHPNPTLDVPFLIRGTLAISPTLRIAVNSRLRPHTHSKAHLHRPIQVLLQGIGEVQIVNSRNRKDVYRQLSMYRYGASGWFNKESSNCIDSNEAALGFQLDRGQT